MYHVWWEEVWLGVKGDTRAGDTRKVPRGDATLSALLLWAITLAHANRMVHTARMNTPVHSSNQRDTCQAPNRPYLSSQVGLKHNGLGFALLLSTALATVHMCTPESDQACFLFMENSARSSCFYIPMCNSVEFLDHTGKAYVYEIGNLSQS
jgi:hypothetical protein